MGRLTKQGTTDAFDRTPNPRENTLRSQDEDLDRMGKGISTDETHPRRRQLIKEAAGRAAARTGSRAALAEAALMGGLKAGEMIDEKFPGVGKKIDKVIDKLSVPSGRVKLTKDAQERADQEQAFQAVEDAMQRIKDQDRGYRNGGLVTARGQGKAMRMKRTRIC